MYAYYNGHGAVDFSARESLRLMLQRQAGNVFPDDDRTASAATGAHLHDDLPYVAALTQAR